MQINKIRAVYFSPNMNTKRIALNILLGLGLNETPIEQWDCTRMGARQIPHAFRQDDLVLAVAPTYGGRLPVVKPGLFSNIRGENTPTIFVIVYGNQGYGDALLEMQRTLEARDFQCFAAAAFVAEHSLSDVVGKGRPDQDDVMMARDFGAEVRQKLDAEDLSPIEVPGNYPYTDIKGFPYDGPVTDATCTRCMACYRWCPADAIPYYDPEHTDYEKCIRCRCCVRRCPIHARAIVDTAFVEKITEFDKAYGNTRFQPEFFV